MLKDLWVDLLLRTLCTYVRIFHKYISGLSEVQKIFICNTYETLRIWFHVAHIANLLSGITPRCNVMLLQKDLRLLVFPDFGFHLLSFISINIISGLLFFHLRHKMYNQSLIHIKSLFSNIWYILIKPKMTQNCIYEYRNHQNSRKFTQFIQEL